MIGRRPAQWYLVAGRLAVAAHCAARLLWGGFAVRRALCRRLGRQWVRERLPELTLKSTAAAGLTLLTVAARPASLSKVHQDARRLEQILATLRRLPRRPYQVATPSGRRVYQAAVTRCLAEILDRPVDAVEFQVPPVVATALTPLLIRWLEDCGVGREQVAFALVPGPANPLSIGEDSPTSGPLNNLRADNEMARIVAAEQLARRELWGCFAALELRHLAIPKAMLSAHKRGTT